MPNLKSEVVPLAVDLVAMSGFVMAAWLCPFSYKVERRLGQLLTSRAENPKNIRNWRSVSISIAHRLVCGESAYSRSDSGRERRCIELLTSSCVACCSVRVRSRGMYWPDPLFHWKNAVADHVGSNQPAKAVESLVPILMAKRLAGRVRL